MNDPAQPTYRIVGDGSPTGTKVFFGEHDITRFVTKVEFTHKGGGTIPEITITASMAMIDVEGRGRLLAMNSDEIDSINLRNGLSIKGRRSGDG